MRVSYVAVACAIALTSCESSGVVVNRSPFIGKTAAEQALNNNEAVNIGLVSPKKLVPGHIYKVADNDFKEICGNDIAQQNKLKVLAPFKTEDTSDTISDKPRDIDIEVLGQSIATYNSIKVKGYKTFDVRNGNSPVDATYILANVKRGKDSCFDTILPRNKPYLVVDQVAEGKEIETWYRRGFGASGALGIVGVRFKPKDEQTGTKTNRVFGATGKLVR